jgi:hypothetical protein
MQRRVVTAICAAPMLIIVQVVLAQDQVPAGTLELETTSVDIGIGASWGDGTLTLANGEKHRAR